MEPLFRIHPRHQSNPPTGFDDSTEGASGRRCAFLFAESALHEGPSVVQWSWWQVGERLRARRPHWTMTRGVACWSGPYLRATRSSEERKRGIAPVTAGKRAGLHRSLPSRSHSSVFVALPARAVVTGRARTKAAVLLLACVFDDRNEEARSGQCCVPLRGGSTTTKRASNHLLGPTSKEGEQRASGVSALQVCLRG